MLLRVSSQVGPLRKRKESQSLGQEQEASRSKVITDPSLSMGFEAPSPTPQLSITPQGRNLMVDAPPSSQTFQSEALENQD